MLRLRRLRITGARHLLRHHPHRLRRRDAGNGRTIRRSTSPPQSREICPVAGFSRLAGQPTPPRRQSPTQANVARSGASAVELAVDPRHQEVSDAGLALGRDVCPFWNLPPFRQAVAAATGTGVLCFEHGMSAHRGLFAVVGRIGRREACADEVLAMATDRLHALVRDVFPVRF